MTEEQQETIKLQTAIRKDIVHTWGERTDQILKACQAHMLDALATELVLHQRFHCISCIQTHLMQDFFIWLNEEGYCYVLEDFDYSEFMSHLIRWTKGWIAERLLSPCTDGMPSAELH